MSALRSAHLRLLEQYRGAMNLIGPGPAAEHFEDCERALADLTPSGRWADLGSGAGFPGLILADLHPTLPLDLVDSRQKRCWFLQHVLDEAGWTGPVQVHNVRVGGLSGPYAGLVSRAFAPPPEVFAVGRRLLAPGGELVLFLQADGPSWTSDAASSGYALAEVRPYRVGGRARRSERWVRGG